MTQTYSFRDVEKLSAYLDGQLKPSEAERLESRIKTDPELASILKDLRQTRSLLRQLPQRRTPRNFTLTPKMVGQKPPLPRAYPTFRFATVLATLLLFITFATNFMAPRLDRVAAPYPYGVGGSGGGGREPETMLESVPAETEESAMAEPVAPELPAPLPSKEKPSVEDSDRLQPTPESSLKSGVQEAPTVDAFAQQMPEQEPESSPARPISVPIQIALAVIAAASALVAFILHYTAIRKWRAKVK